MTDIERMLVNLSLAGKNSLEISIMTGIDHQKVKDYLEAFFRCMEVPENQKYFLN